MKKVLVVDDQATIRQLVEMILQSHGCRILQAESGEQGIEMAQADVPDLIIMDIMMPGGMDGFEAVEVLKADPKTRKCNVLMLTAKAQTVEREKAFEVGADDYLAKPFKMGELIEKVDELMT